MGDRSAIEWCDATWNPWQGCHKVSLGCKHCYMFREKKRYGQEPNVVVRSKSHTFNLPLRLKEPQRVFTCSWSDFFVEEADPWRPEAWDIINRTRHLTYQIVTKRIERVADHLPWGPQERPWPHVWIIVSVEDQSTVDELGPELLAVNAAVHGLSVEPLLGPVDLTRYLSARCHESFLERSLHWVIVGGESGGPPERALVERRHPGPENNRLHVAFNPWCPKPEALTWVRSLRDQCVAAGVPFFFKQWGGPTPTSGGRLLDGKEWSEFPR